MLNQQLLEIAIHACLKGGEKIMEVYEKPFRVNYKEDNSPVTQADVQASKVISEMLLPTGIPVISEEENIPDYETRKNYKRIWLVDPLDGTKEFVKKNGEFSVNIGLIENNFPLLGVVFMPVLKEIYFASPETGAYKLPHGIFASHNVKDFDLNEFVSHAKKLPAQKQDTYTIVASRSHLSKDTYAHLQKMKLEKGETNIVYSGSSVKMCWVAEGKADEYPRFGRTMEWDTAAGQSIVECAGGSFLHMQTRERLSYNKPSLDNPEFIVLNKKT
ncbi:MAG: 3'(2'),5'-bisphosphate nucleotidase CysQ [Bacteroidia bacterium]